MILEKHFLAVILLKQFLFFSISNLFDSFNLRIEIFLESLKQYYKTMPLANAWYRL